MACDLCGFDTELYTRRSDATSTLEVIPFVLRAAAEDLASAVLNERPDDSTWSIAEYAEHVREVYAVHREALEAAFENPAEPIDWPDVAPFRADRSEVDFDAVAECLESEATALESLVAHVSDADWGRGVERHVLNVVHEGLHHFADMGRVRHRLGHGAAPAEGIVGQVSVSNGGVPICN